MMKVVNKKKKIKMRMKLKNKYIKKKTKLMIIAISGMKKIIKRNINYE